VKDLRAADIICIGTSFFFTCLNSVDPNDSSAFLMDGQLIIPGNLLHDLVFNPVLNQVCIIIFYRLLYLMVYDKQQVLALIEEQMTKVDQPVDALFIVGGFAGSEYLKNRIEVCRISSPGKMHVHLYQGQIYVENWVHRKTSECRCCDVTRSSPIWFVKKAAHDVRYSTALVYDQSMFARISEAYFTNALDGRLNFLRRKKTWRNDRHTS